MTLSNGRRVLLDDEGRVAGGRLPEMFRQVHVRDIAALGRSVREAERAGAECERLVRRRRPKTFRTTEEAVRALLAANPQLLDFLELECGTHCEQYARWVRRGRRGPKPQARFGDGRFDAIEVPLELEGKRRVSSWLEATYLAVPPSHRWEDFPERLQLLADATGLTLNLPPQAEGIEVEAADVEACHQHADERIERLIALAREARLDTDAPPAGDEDDVPF